MKKFPKIVKPKKLFRPLYLLVVWGTIEPAWKGPYADVEERLAAAKALVQKDREGENGLFMVDLRNDGLPPDIYTFSGAQTDAWLSELTDND